MWGMRYFFNARPLLLWLAGSCLPDGCCRNTGCSSPGPRSVIVTAANANSTVQLNAGDVLLVQLDGNPSTGYTWERVEPLAGALQPLGEPEFVPAKNLPGAPGRITLRYLAASGSARLELVYHRPWETDTPPVATFSVVVLVK